MTAIGIDLAGFSHGADRLADDIRNEVQVCIEHGADPDWLRDICRSATAAVDIVREARAHAEAAYCRAREAAR